jgi:hypothetical protein
MALNSVESAEIVSAVGADLIAFSAVCAFHFIIGHHPAEPQVLLAEFAVAAHPQHPPHLFHPAEHPAKDFLDVAPSALAVSIPLTLEVESESMIILPVYIHIEHENFISQLAGETNSMMFSHLTRV